MDEIVLTVTGMGCRACEERIERGVRGLAGVRLVSAEHTADRVEVIMDSRGSESVVREFITAAGFEVA